MSGLPLRLSCHTAHAVPSGPTATSGKSLSAAVSPVIWRFAVVGHDVAPAGSRAEKMLFWLERRSTHTAISAPAGVPAMRGLRCTGLPVASVLTVELGAQLVPVGL